MAKEGGRVCLTDGERHINGGGVREGGKCMLSLAATDVCGRGISGTEHKDR